MLPEEVQAYAGKGGLVAFIAIIVWFLVWLIKTDTLNKTLARLSLPPVPKAALPWLAFGLGSLLSTLDAILAGKAPQEALMAALWGALSGGLAVGAHETVGKQAGRVRAKRAKKKEPKPEPETDFPV